MNPLCDICGLPVPGDDAGQHTADTIVCEPCCQRLLTRSQAPPPLPDEDDDDSEDPTPLEADLGEPVGGMR